MFRCSCNSDRTSQEEVETWPWWIVAIVALRNCNQWMNIVSAVLFAVPYEKIRDTFMAHLYECFAVSWTGAWSPWNPERFSINESMSHFFPSFTITTGTRFLWHSQYILINCSTTEFYSQWHSAWCKLLHMFPQQNSTQIIVELITSIKTFLFSSTTLCISPYKRIEFL